MIFLPQPAPGGLCRASQCPGAVAKTCSVCAYMSHTRNMAPQEKPAPNSVRMLFSPYFSWFLYSSRQMGIDAAEVLPVCWMFTSTFSIGTPALSATASMMRRLAWWGTR